MLLRIVSDLHLEGFKETDPEKLKELFIGSDLLDKESVLVLAGDISSKKEKLFSFLEVCSKYFAKVLFVPGNHEFYFHQFDDYNTELRNEFRRYDLTPDCNIIGVAGDEVKAVTIDGVYFVLATLWGDGGLSLDGGPATDYEKYILSRSVNDFYNIKKNDAKFTVDDMIKIYI